MAALGEPSFFEKIEARAKSINSLLCVGLDPHRVDLEKLGEVSAATAFLFCDNIVDHTKKFAVAYKPNGAFFEAYGAEGIAALEKLIAYIPDEIPCLLDIKRGDSGSTASAYAEAAFLSAKADGVTLSPYMGSESIAPFIKDRTKGAFVICKTSNPSSNELQVLTVSEAGGHDGVALFEKVAALCESWNTQNNVGVVVGATDIDALARVRAAAPGLWILAPGIGAQGGQLAEAVGAGLRTDGFGLLVPISRGISRSEHPGAAAELYVANLNDARKKSLETAKSSNNEGLKQYQSDFIQFALGVGVLKFGRFTLKSGRESPYFFNAGLFNSGLSLARIGEFYAKVIVESKLEFDVLFGPAYKGITLASTVSIALTKYGMDIPYAYNRKEAKDHGEGGLLVGAPVKGKRCLLVDDVITAGTAIREAIGILSNAGAEAAGVLIALDRQEKKDDTSTKSAIQGVRDEFGIPVHYVVGLDHLLSFARKNDSLSGMLPDIEAYRKKYGISY